MLNMFQYLILAIIPILLVNKLISTYIPPVDRSKSTIEVTTELLIQLVLLFSFIFFIHKLILFIPTYTNTQYPTIQFLPIVLPLMFVLFNLDKNFGEKAHLLMDRILMMVGMKKENFEGADLEEEESKQQIVNKNVIGQTCGTQMLPPQISNPNSVMVEAPSRKTDRETPQMQQQYGIAEPMAANEMGGYSMF